MYVHWGNAGQTGEPGRRKKDQSVLAVHQFLEVIENTAEDRKALFTQSQQSRRKATKLAYLLLASETEPAAIHDAFRRSGLLSGGQRSNKPEALLWLAGALSQARPALQAPKSNAPGGCLQASFPATIEHHEHRIAVCR